MIKVYGEQEKGKHPTETAEMVTFFNQIRLHHPKLAKIALHIRNEGKRTFDQARRHKAEGMVTGASDINIPGNPSFICEMKSRSKTSRVSPEQYEYLEAAQENGAFCCIAYGCKAALEAVMEWQDAQGR